MRQLIIGVVLAVCLFGCGEKPKFSITKHDTVETYDNNPNFKKISFPNGSMVYTFSGTPISIQEIKTDDLGIRGGSVFISSPEATSFIVFIGFKGEEKMAQLLIDRLKKVGDKRNINCNDIDNKIFCHWDENDKNQDIYNFVLVYSKEIDDITLSVIINKK